MGTVGAVGTVEPVEFDAGAGGVVLDSARRRLTSASLNGRSPALMMPLPMAPTATIPASVAAATAASQASSTPAVLADGLLTRPSIVCRG